MVKKLKKENTFVSPVGNKNKWTQTNFFVFVITILFFIFK